MSQNDPVITESGLRRILDESFKIFGERLKKEIVEEVTEEVTEKVSRQVVDDIVEVIKDFAEHVDKRFNKIEKDISIIKKDIKQLKISVINIETRLDVIDVANQARDSQLTRHERWHYQAANKLQITLN